MFVCRKWNVQNQSTFMASVLRAGPPVWVVFSLQMFGVFSEQVGQVGHGQHGGLRVLQGCAGVTRNTKKDEKLTFLNINFKSKHVKLRPAASHLFSAVFSIACILSSIVDLMRNL